MHTASYEFLMKPKESAGCHQMRRDETTPIKCPIPISQLCLTSHFMCVQSFHMVNIDVPAGVGAPPT